MSAQEHAEYMKGWDKYQFEQADISACTSELQRRGWLAARRAEEEVFMDEARAYAEREAMS